MNYRRKHPESILNAFFKEENSQFKMGMETVGNMYYADRNYELILCLKMEIIPSYFRRKEMFRIIFFVSSSDVASINSIY